MEPPPPGVKPVRREDSLGVGKPLKDSLKKSVWLVGPVSIAGLKGPARRDCQPGVIPGSGDGDVMLATGGRTVFPGVSAGPEEPPKEASNGLGSTLKVLCTLHGVSNRVQET